MISSGIAIAAGWTSRRLWYSNPPQNLKERRKSKTPISIDHAKKIQTLTADLADIIRETNPVSVKEWAAFESLVNAHKDLTKIDTGEFMQLPMNLDHELKKEAKPRKDCPRCSGTGIFVDPIAPNEPGRPCYCKDVEKAAWSEVKADWKALLKHA